jgi:excisionase family DNA binding protein
MHGTPTGLAVSPIFTVKEVATILKTSPHTIQWYIKRGDLLAFPLGRGFRIQATDLQAFLNQKKQEMQSQPEAMPEGHPC